MILDRLDKADTYADADGGLAEAFLFLRRGDFNTSATGARQLVVQDAAVNRW